MRLQFPAVLLFPILVVLVGCGLLEPEEKKGAIQIQIGDTITLSKAIETIDLIDCILKRSTDTVHVQEYQKQGSRFIINIDGLKPASNYSVLLYGKNASGDIIGRGHEEPIDIAADDVTHVWITWDQFNPTLISPTNGETINDKTPTFDWSSVGDVSQYELQVDNSPFFKNLEINQIGLTTSDYTPSTALSENTYYWRVRSKDRQGSYSGWSSTWSFNFPYINITSPNGGWTWYAGENKMISWISNGTSGEVKIEYSTKGGRFWQTVTTSTKDDGLYTWLVPNTPSTDCYVKVTDVDGSPTDRSNHAFTIEYVGITVNSPNGGEKWYAGENRNIIWRSKGHSGNVNIEYSTNGGSAWMTVATSTNDDGLYAWSVPNTPSTDCYVKVTDVDGSPADQGNSAFTIYIETGTVMDIDGNLYQTINIGNRRWTTTNLKVTQYRNGDPIPDVNGDMEWCNLTTGARCSYYNDVNNVESYGFLYNWYAVNDERNIAPTGWHVPTDWEWYTLIEYLGGYSVAGGKMKDTGIDHWQSPNTGATNESGFTALPGGYRIQYGDFLNLGKYATFWSSTKDGIDSARNKRLFYNSSELNYMSHDRHYGLSVRCVRDY